MTLFKNMGMNPIAAPTDFHGKNQQLPSTNFWALLGII
jgi:hypothetical protein